MKKVIRKILKEDRQEQFLNKIILLMKDEYPIFKKLKDYGFYDDLSISDLNYVLYGIFGEPVIKSGYKINKIYNKNRNLLYWEGSGGYWQKREYDENGYQIYYEDSDVWIKQEYDENGNEIYREDSSGVWFKREYDENGYQTYYENSDGNWVKREYDDNGYILYKEDSNGDWVKQEFNENGNRIYFEDSNGRIMDNR